jgi:hypothetical protein
MVVSNTLPSTSAVLPRHEKPSSRVLTSTQRINAYLRQDIDPTSRLLEIELLLLALAIGIQDAISFPEFHCFASNQTGNTVLLAVGVLMNRDVGEQVSMFSTTTIAISLGFFILGVLVTGQAANYFRVAQVRGWLVLSNFLSTALVYVAAALQWRLSSLNPNFTRIVLGLLAFSSGSQVAMVRGLKITDITTAMATAAYIDIFIDPKLFANLSENRGRNRRILFLVMLVVGSFVGAGVGSKLNFGVAVLISAIVKSLVTFMMLFNRGKNV